MTTLLIFEETTLQKADRVVTRGAPFIIMVAVLVFALNAGIIIAKAQSSFEQKLDERLWKERTDQRLSVVEKKLASNGYAPNIEMLLLAAILGERGLDRFQRRKS